MLGTIWNWLKWRRQSRKLVSEIISLIKDGFGGAQLTTVCKLTTIHDLPIMIDDDSLENGYLKAGKVIIRLPKSQSRRLRYFLRARRVVGAREAIICKAEIT